MSELSPPNASAPPWPGAHGRADDSDATTARQPRLLWNAVLFPAFMAVLGAAAVAAVVVNPTQQMVIIVAAVAVPVCAVILIAAVLQAKRNSRAVKAQLDGAHEYVQQGISTLRSWTAAFQEEIVRFVEQVRRGERPTPRSPEAVPGKGSHPFWFLAYDLCQAQNVAETAVVRAAGERMMSSGTDSEQRVAVFLNLSRRLQSLVHRKIKKLDELESNVEDPDLLKGLFVVDHLATGVRRQAENLAVLGGAVPRRQWSTPVSMFAVVRSAVAEVEQYARVKVVQPIEGTLRGHAVAEVIHLIAELVENATRFSAPDTQVVLRAQKVTAGLAIEIEDRGLGISTEDQRRINELLSSPTRIDLGELLQDGRIGLWVVSELARRHGVAVRLRSNIFGGIEAVAVIPHKLLGESADEQESSPAGQRSLQESASTIYSTASSRSGGSLSSTGEILLPTGTGEAAPTSGQALEQPERSFGKAGEMPTVLERRLSDGSHESTADTRSVAAAGATRAARASGGARAAGGDERPPLPRRSTRTSYLVPELLDAPANNESAVGHDPGLMSAFQKGLKASTNEDSGPPDRANQHS